MITDYKGNEIKPGMEICWVTTILRHPQIGILFQGKMHMEEKKPEEPCWLPGTYYRVDENLRAEIKGHGDGEGYTFSVPISKTPILEDCVLAIKGISDQPPTTNTDINPHP